MTLSFEPDCRDPVFTVFITAIFEHYIIVLL